MAYKTLPDSSRVWIYQSNREFHPDEVASIRNKGEQFTQKWAAHGTQLNADMEVFYNRFIVLFADESNAGASGCSIDASVHFMQSLEREYGVNLMDRMQLSYRDGEAIKTASMSDFETMINNGDITSETIVFNNLVQDKGTFEKEWEVPVKQSWHRRMIPIKAM